MSGPVAKASIAEIELYRPGKAKAAGHARPIKLSSNENPLGCSPGAQAAYARAGAHLNRYPDARAMDLRQALADRHGLDPERIIFGTGSDEIFSMVCQAYLTPGDVMVQPHYAFAAWAIAARAAGAAVISAPERDYTVDVDAMLAAVNGKTKLMFVANPASPTGTCLPYREIERLHAGLPQHVLLVLDGAYAEYAEGLPDYESGLALAGAAPNVIATRTFSKVHGLAALRLGWGYASAEIIGALSRIRLPFNSATAAQAAAVASLEDQAFLSRSVALARAGVERLTRLAEELGLSPLPSSSNFVTVRVPDTAPLTAAELDRALTEDGILVRALDNYRMPDALRITIGTDEEMDALERALRKSLQRA